MTKLLIATGIFHPESGGPATYLYHLLPHLQKHGYETQVLTFGDSTIDNSIYPYPVTRIPRTSYPTRLWHYYTTANRLTQWADMLYVHSALLPLPPSRKPRVLKIVGDQAWERAVQRKWVSQLTDIDAFQFLKSRHPMVSLLRRSRKRAARAADGIIVPSEYLKKMVTRWGVMANRIHVVYNALPPQEETLTLSQVEARAKLGLDVDRPLLLSVARLVPWKGVDDFIVAMKQIPDLHYVVAGDGAMREALEQFAIDQGVGDRVSFLGRVPREQVAIYMKAADYLGLYSGYEGLPHVVLESLRAGTPVIASHKGGNPEVVQHDVNGLLVPWDDIPALEQALQIAFQPGKRDELAANSYLGMERFDYEQMIANTIATLEKFR